MALAQGSRAPPRHYSSCISPASGSARMFGGVRVEVGCGGGSAECERTIARARTRPGQPSSRESQSQGFSAAPHAGSRAPLIIMIPRGNRPPLAGALRACRPHRIWQQKSDTDLSHRNLARTRSTFSSTTTATRVHSLVRRTSQCRPRSWPRRTRR